MLASPSAGQGAGTPPQAPAPHTGVPVPELARLEKERQDLERAMSGYMHSGATPMNGRADCGWAATRAQAGVYSTDKVALRDMASTYKKVEKVAGTKVARRAIGGRLPCPYCEAASHDLDAR